MGLAAAAGLAAVGSIGGALISSSASSDAANMQQQSNQAAIDQQQQQYNQARADFAPFRQAGVGALGQYVNLVGTNGAQPQQDAITALQTSPYYQSLYRNGQEAVLQNAAATGGIRGGNTQRSLADFGADTLAQTIQQQLGNLGGIINVGAGATSTNASLGANSADNISSLLARSGNIAGNNAATQGGIWSGALNGLTGSINQALFPSRYGFGSNPYGGNAMVGFGGDPYGMAGSSGAAFMPDYTMPVNVGF